MPVFRGLWLVTTDLYIYFRLLNVKSISQVKLSLRAVYEEKCQNMLLVLRIFFPAVNDRQSFLCRMS